MRSAIHVPHQQVQQRFNSFAHTPRLSVDASRAATFMTALLGDLWLAQRFHAHGARTATGATLHILDPGLPSGNGPAFRDAHLIMDGQHVRGDIAIHPTSTFWFEQSCHLDEGYRNTILHVVLSPDFWTGGLLTLSGNMLEELVLCSYLEQACCQRLQTWLGQYVFSNDVL